MGGWVSGWMDGWMDGWINEEERKMIAHLLHMYFNSVKLTKSHKLA
jgi:hypothetical protein